MLQRKSLTVIQATTLARLSVLGYTNLNYNNLHFTKNGKIAIIDTDPKKRWIKKGATSSHFNSLFGDKGTILCLHSIIGMAYLKLYIDKPDALRAVEKIERNHALWNIAKLITKIFITTAVIFFTPTLTALIPIAGVATLLKVTVIAAALLKDFCLADNILAVASIWRLSHRGIQGINTIYNMENQGTI